MILSRLLLLLPFVTPMQPLASYIHHNRVLLVFAPTENDPRFKEQIRLLKQHAAELKERDLLLVTNVVQADPTAPRVFNPHSHTAEQQLSQRTQFHIGANEFTVILIGKDGGEKLRQHRPIEIEKLVTTIDAMPMRQDEMRGKK